MTHAVRAGRVLALLIATGCVLIFAGLARRILRDWRVALLATLAFALLRRLAVHSRILAQRAGRSLPVIFALMILIAIGRRAMLARPLGMAAAGGLCVVGLENKVQAILLIGALPLLILPFGSAESRERRRSGTTRAGWLAAAIAALVAAAAPGPPWPLVGTGLDRALLDAAHFHPLAAPAASASIRPRCCSLIAVCMIAYAAIWRVSPAETLASILAVAAGASIALLVLNVDYNASNVIAVINPLEKMLTFADAGTANAANGSNLSRSSSCCSMGSPRCWRATLSCCTPRRGRPCSSSG